MKHERLLSRVLLGTALVVGAGLRLYAAATDDGIYWPDETYQSLEPAHRAVFGYGLVPWEFVEGARHWATPGFIAALLFACKLIGLASAAQYVTVVKGVFALIAVSAAGATWWLSRRAGASELFAGAAALAFALGGPMLYFGHRAMSENLSAACAVWGLALLWPRQSSRVTLVAGASVLGLGVLFRLQGGLFAAMALLMLLARREWKSAGVVAATLGVWAVLFGWTDHLTWADAPGARFGGWFHSAFKYVQFNVVEGRAAGWGTADNAYYLRTLWSSAGLLMVPLALGLLVSFVASPWLAAIVVAFTALHSFVPHKELRFVVPMLPLWCACAALGLERLAKLKGGAAWAVALAALTLPSAVHARSLTFQEVGGYVETPKAAMSAWDDYGPVNRLLEKAGRRDDLCGIFVGVAAPAWQGGYTYLHKNVPLYWDPAHINARHGNYAIVFPGTNAPVMETEAGLELVKVFDPPCEPDPGFSWRLP